MLPRICTRQVILFLCTLVEIEPTLFLIRFFFCNNGMSGAIGREDLLIQAFYIKVDLLGYCIVSVDR